MHTHFLLHQPPSHTRTHTGTHTHTSTHFKEGTGCAGLQSREHCDSVSWISTGNHIDRIRAANQKCGCEWAHTHFNMLLLISKDNTLFSVFLWVCACLFKHKLMWIFTTAGPVSSRFPSHWLVPPCKHTPTCYWFILSSIHSTRTDHSLAGGEGGRWGGKGEGICV